MSSAAGPCDVPFRYASDQPPAVARSHAHLRGLAPSIHETSGLGFSHKQEARAAIPPLLIQLQFPSPVVDHLRLSNVIQIRPAIDLSHKIRKGLISVSVSFSLLLRVNLTHNRISK
jgi:hypothetical protein